MFRLILCSLSLADFDKYHRRHSLMNFRTCTPDTAMSLSLNQYCCVDLLHSAILPEQLRCYVSVKRSPSIRHKYTTRSGTNTLGIAPDELRSCLGDGLRETRCVGGANVTDGVEDDDEDDELDDNCDRICRLW